VILTQLDLSSFRNVKAATIEPHPSLNLITGNNGSGKSSILESIQCLATGHSFRTRKAREFIRKSADEFTVTALFHDPKTSRDHRAGLKRQRDGTVDMRLDYEEISRISDVTRLLPVKALTPDSHKLIQEGPEERRQFLDWGVFHVEHGFMDIWRQFKRSLSQRNQLLRENGSKAELSSWDELFLSAANHQYRTGWSTDFELAELLVRNSDYHRRMKTTTDGPHRAEMAMNVDGLAAKQYLSRGQQKVLVYLLHLSQLDLLQARESRQAIVLCDDLTSELDDEHSHSVIQQLVDLNGQIFVSGVDLSVLTNQKHDRYHMINGEAEKIV